MCFFDSPTPPAEPVKPQEAKMPDTLQAGSSPVADARKRMSQSGGYASSTLLTGPSGVENNMLSIGRTTLLGQ